MANLQTETPKTERFSYVENPDNWYAVEMVQEGVYAVREPNHIEDVLCFVMQTNEGDVLIDAGMGIVDLNLVLKDIEGLNLNIKKVLLTHTHNDHIGGLHYLDKTIEVLVFDDKFSVFNLQNGLIPEQDISKLSQNGYLNILPDEFLNGAKATSLVSEFIIPPYPNFSTFQDGQKIEIGGLTFLVIYTPGHSPDSVCFFIEELGVLITGDTLYNGPIFLQLNESNLKQYIESIKKLYLLTNGKVKIILPGHNHSSQPPELLEAIYNAVIDLENQESEEGEGIFGEYKRYLISGRLSLDCKADESIEL